MSVTKRIEELEQDLATCEKRRAEVEGMLADRERILDSLSPVPEAAMRRHVFAQARLLLMRGEASIQNHGWAILMCCIGTKSLHIVVC